jgi:16S rRNA C967 or C1407 C5-methylase (RsmB/RsmF family)/NOL1/NOP2/fmu family ribosome biogenesis protein
MNMNLPEAFTRYTTELLGEEEYRKLASALTEEPAVSVRFNPLKPLSSVITGEKVAWSDYGFYLDERLTFTFDPLFHAGCYYVQEASSMFVERALRQYAGCEPLRMLDLCAAPGGKSTHAISLLPAGSLLVSNEVMRNRAQILAENITKWGATGTVVTNNDPSDFSPLTAFFDIILTDVPCSGEGMFRKDAVAVSEWSEENVATCWQRQRRIISDIWPCLKPGGLLIYSTCTFNTSEDEENVRWIAEEFGAEVLPVATEESWGITGNLLSGTDFPVYRFIPGRTRGEGFFLAALRKPADDEADATSFTPRKSKKKDKKQGGGKTKSQPTVGKAQLAKAAEWIDSNAALTVAAGDTNITAIPTTYADDIELLKQTLRVMQAGIEIGEVKGNDVIPSHSLAMSSALLPTAFERYDVTYDQAIAYLRKEAISLPSSVSRGYILLTYDNIPLGFVKNVGNRANNLYPQEWRIRSGYLPEEVKLITGISK